MDVLPAELAMGPVRLRVANRDLMVGYYRDTLGLEFVSEEGSEIRLGHGGQTTLIVDHQPQLKHAGSREAGLFHTAFLFPSPAEISPAVYRVATAYPESFTGSADHLVSEAFYFDDPEGNGVELYVDRDRSTWKWHDGSIAMDTLPLDPNKYLRTHLSDTRVTPSDIGHVHLCVGDIAQAQAFYVNTLGFEQTLNYGGSAIFVSAGGYHHHMAMNVWRSRGANRRLQTLGLGSVSINLGSEDALGAVRERLRAARVDIRDDGKNLRVEDPWGNTVILGL